MEWARQLCFALELTGDSLKDIQGAIDLILSLDKKYISTPEVKKLQRLYLIVQEEEQSIKQAQDLIAAYIDSLKNDRKKDYLIAYVLQYKTDAEITEQFFFAEPSHVYHLKGDAVKRLMDMPARQAEKIKSFLAAAQEKYKKFFSEKF